MELTTIQENELEVALSSLKEQEQELKEIEKQVKQQKADIKTMFEQVGVKSFETDDFKITLIQDTQDEEVETEKFNEKKFKEEEPLTYSAYLDTITTTKKGRKGYVRISEKK